MLQDTVSHVRSDALSAASHCELCSLAPSIGLTTSMYVHIPFTARNMYIVYRISYIVHFANLGRWNVAGIGSTRNLIKRRQQISLLPLSTADE
jgi:hypothetical protein